MQTAEELAANIYEAIQDASNFSERSQQSADFRMGVSDMGFCSEKVRRMLMGQAEPPGDKLAAFIGTAIGDHAEQALKAKYPHLIIQSEVSLTLDGEGGRTYVVSGHPDVIDPVEGIVIDMKTARGLEYVKRDGPDRQKQFQRHAYALGAWEAGMFPDHKLEEIRVANCWLDRGGDDKYAHVNMEPYNPDIITEMGEWLDEVVYAYLHGEEARKEPPREMCAKACGHFLTCRAGDTDVEGLLTDPEVLTAVDMYQEGLELERAGKRLKDQGKIRLVGVEGSTGQFAVRWTTVQGTTVSYKRDAYMKLDLKKVK